MAQKCKSLKEALTRHPDAHIHYWDNGSWSIYDRYEWAQYLAAEKEWLDGDGDEPEDYPEPVYEGDDYGANGYASELVEELARKLGMTVGSV